MASQGGVREGVKRTLRHAVNGVGLTVDRARRSRAAHILTYHQVRLHPEEIRDPYNEVTLARLEEHVRALQAAGLRLVTVSDLWTRLRAGAEASSLVALTFDDGLEEHVDRVAPLLAGAGAAATFYVPSACIGRPAKEVGYTGRHLSGEAVRRLAAAGMEVGSHSRTHPVLARLDVDGLAQEISGSRRDLEDLLGQAPRSFSYPYGSRRTFDARVLAAVRTAGYETAVCTVPGGNTAATPAYELRRIAVYQGDGPSLAVAKARGAMDWTGALQEIWLRLFPHDSVRPA